MVFDTSALLLSIDERIDVISNIREIIDDLVLPVVTVSVVRELWLLARRGGRRGRVANLVLTRLIPVYFSIASLDGRADDDVLKLAKEANGVLVTCDMELKRRAEGEGVTVAYYREAFRRFTIDA